MIGLVLAGGVKADDSLWKLAYEDEFNRAEVGDQWIYRTGTARIVDGRLEKKVERAVFQEIRRHLSPVGIRRFQFVHVLCLKFALPADQ